MNNLFSISFWLNTRPGSLNPIVSQVFLVFAVLLFSLFIVLFFLKKQKNSLYYKTLDKLQSFCFTNFFIFIFLLFFSYELIPVLSARFWFLLLFLEIILWLYFIFKEIQKIPLKRKALEDRQAFEKYLP